MSDSRDGWWRVSGPKWTFGVRVRSAVVVDAANISRTWIGKPAGDCLRWWKAKGGDSFIKVAP